jgi:hypothetical protein
LPRRIRPRGKRVGKRAGKRADKRAGKRADKKVGKRADKRACLKLQRKCLCETGQSMKLWRILA